MMAMYMYGVTKCLLCEKIIFKEDTLVAFTHFLTDRSDPLWKFSDSILHKDCFEKWEHKEEFRAKHKASTGHDYGEIWKDSPPPLLDKGVIARILKKREKK